MILLPLNSHNKY